MKNLYKVFFLAIAIIGLNTFSAKAVNITASGIISTNTTWNADTVKVTGDITVNNGVTLTISAGTYVQFQGHHKLDIQGRILAQGTATNKITFTALNQSTGWTGIKFNSTPATNDTSIIEYCIISYGKANSGDYYDMIGGAILCKSFSKLIIRNNIISNNYSSYYGGAIACWTGSSPKIINNVISNNTASSLGGGIFIYSSSNPDVINNTIVNNSSGSQGGGIIAYSSSCHPRIINCIIWGNTSSSYPQVGKSPYPIVENCNIEGGYTGLGNIDTLPHFVSPSSGVGYTFNGLTADWGIQSTSPCRNAGIYPAGYGVSMLDVAGNFRYDEGTIDIGALEYVASTQVCGTISSNTSWSGDVLITCDVLVDNGITLTIQPGTKVTFLGQYHLDIDGRLLAVGTMDSMIIFNCYNQNEGWYGIDFYNTLSTNDTSKIEYCKIKNGKATSSLTQDKYGGGIYIYNVSKLIVRSNIISNNSAYYGGAIYLRNSSAKIINNVIVNNTATSSYAGGIYIYSTSSSYTPSITNNTIANNSSTSSGAGIYRLSSIAPVITNNIIWGNESPYSGIDKQIYPSTIPNVQYNDIEGGTYSGTGNISSNPLFKNPSNGAGITYNGANKNWSLQETSLCIDAGTPSTAGLELPAVDLLGKTRVYSAAVDIGAYEDKSSLSACGTISTNTTWDANTINVTCDVTVSNGAKLTILPGTKVKFTGSYRLTIQGSLYAVGTETDTIHFTTDDPTTGWKGIYINNPNEYYNDSTIIHDCRIEYLNYPTSSGGSIYAYYSDELRISNCLIKNNSNTSGRGGGIGLYRCNAIIQNNVIKNNNSRYGAGISCYYSYDDVIKNNKIENNTALYNGGGIYLRYSTTTVANNLISNNKTTYAGNAYSFGGGGLWVEGYDIPTIKNNIIVNNQSGYYGGGISIYNDAKPLFFNNTIANNFSSHFGGGLMVTNNADPVFKNNIFYNDSAGNVSGGNEVYLYDVTSDPKFYNCLVKGGSVLFDGPGSQLNYNGVYNDNIDENPLFSSPSAGSGVSYDGSVANWYIDSLSPCINAGISDTSGMGYIATDYAGNARFNKGRIDIGAYENQEDIYAECTISSNTIWEADTIKVGCDVLVENGVTLIISPGTYVEFQGHYKLDIQGRLLAIGTFDEPIIFSVVDTTGFYDISTTNGCWNGIEFNSTAYTNDTSKIIYCEIKYGKAKESSIYNSNGGGLYIYNYSKVVISNSIISNNIANYYGGGIYLESSNPIIKNSIICNNSATRGTSSSYGGG
ncbi:MAG: right-handed parallel beta-helix repeat-containing protein, partial [Saprospiraceae bacterium]|nr:right-handed parallel beta-helix repeat-containing protein [Saprospiraceae bacterium]